MNNDSSQQLSPKGDGRKDEIGGLLAAASDFARSVLESIQALAGTTSCKGVQIASLKDWANELFPDCEYLLLGFAKNHDGKTCAVLRQPFILSQREATQAEIDEEMEQLGFHKETG